MNEASLTRSLVKALERELPGCVVFKHFDVVTTGMPDLSVTWGRRTCWVEVKYDEGEVGADQIVTMRRLAQVGVAFFVEFNYTSGIAVTNIIDPHDSQNNCSFSKHDVRKVAEFIRKKIEETHS